MHLPNLKSVEKIILSFRYDCIAIADFQMGAMENWGLVTFRETAVLVDPKNTSAKTKQWVSNHSFKRWGYQPQNFICEKSYVVTELLRWWWYKFLLKTS